MHRFTINCLLWLNRSVGVVQPGNGSTNPPSAQVSQSSSTSTATVGGTLGHTTGLLGAAPCRGHPPLQGAHRSLLVPKGLLHSTAPPQPVQFPHYSILLFHRSTTLTNLSVSSQATSLAASAPPPPPPPPPGSFYSTLSRYMKSLCSQATSLVWTYLFPYCASSLLGWPSC